MCCDYVQSAKQHAQACQGKMKVPVARQAWVDVAPDAPVQLLPVDIPIHASHIGQGRHVSPSRIAQLKHRSDYDDHSEPDVDAVSVRGQPNRTAIAVQREMRAGQRVHVISDSRASMYGASMYGNVDEDDVFMDDDGPCVVRVRDPEPVTRARSAPRIRQGNSNMQSQPAVVAHVKQGNMPRVGRAT